MRIGQAGDFQHALHAAVFAEAAMQRVEHHFRLLAALRQQTVEQMAQIALHVDRW